MPEVRDPLDSPGPDASSDPAGSHGQTDSSGPVLDSATIAELRRLQAEYGKPAFLTELVSIFTTNAPGRMTAIRAAIEQRDPHALEHVSHTLKSNCGMLGALRMSALCASFEEAAAAADFTRAAALLPEAEAEFARVLAAVERLAGIRDPGSGAREGESA